MQLALDKMPMVSARVLAIKYSKEATSLKKVKHDHYHSRYIFLLDHTCRKCKKRLLKKIPMSVIDHRDCRNRLRKATRPGKTIPVLGNRFKLHKSFTCAGGNLNHDTCTGDGGSPLVCAKKGTVGKDKRYVQVSQLQYKAGCLP